MADGEAGTERDAISAQKPSAFSRILAHRQTPYWITFSFGSIGLATILGSHFLGYIKLDQLFLARISLASMCALTVFSFALAFRDTSDNFAHGPKPTLPALCLGLLIIATLFIVAARSEPEFAAWLATFSSDRELLAYKLAFLLSPLFIMGVNAARISGLQAIARREIETRRAGSDAAVDADREDAEAMGALLATLAIAALSLLATSAAQWGENLQLQALYGVGLSAFVVGIFGVVIFLEPLSQMGFVGGLSRALKWVSRRARFLAHFYGGLGPVPV